MGVPGLFSSLIKEHNSEETQIIKKSIDNDLTNHFYLDFNCALYTALYANPDIKTEDTLIIYIIEYLETLCKIIPDLSLIYIAIDGCPPAGKQVQQRARRFHSICKRNRINKINDTFGSEIDKTKVNNEIDTNIFTPGTAFMYELSAAIKKAIKTSEVFRNTAVIFSDASIPSEGEHKILHHLKLAAHVAIDGTDKEKQLYGTPHNTIIYGLDGDLIHLSLINGQSNTYLFREANEYGNLASNYEGKKFLFMDIDTLSLGILESFKKYLPTLDMKKSTNSQYKQKYIDDYVFISMLLGNDFMPKNHWYSIYEGGYDKLMSSYFQIHNHTEDFLVDSTSLQINTEMLCDIMFLIKEQEQSAVIKLFEKRKKARVYIKPEMSERERQQLITDFYPLQHLYVEQAIEPTKPNWQMRYYKICFNMENGQDNLSMVCQSYLKTLVYNFLYYFDECPSNEWYYPYAYAPTFTDVYDELLKHKNINATSSNKIFHFKQTPAIDQQTLLFSVLPFSSRFLMVKDAGRKLSDPKCPMNIYFPKRYGLNVAFHRYYHECTPIIYRLDMDKIKKFMKECKFTEDELRRNLVGDLFIMNA
uniref:Xrn1 N-terminal domain-containing protein n=1 Tax=viral metagenome TaxID=1070528 RepID=A0A6C0EYQ2_9ZZZZ